jgi:hypothetical protein
MNLKQQFRLAYRAERENPSDGPTYWSREFQRCVGYRALSAAAAAIAVRNHARHFTTTADRLSARRQIAELTMEGLFRG